MTTIPNASYHVYDSCPRIDSPTSWAPGGVGGQSKTVSFYTAIGELLETMDHKFEFPLVDQRLDASAPNPQPVSYRRVLWPAFQLGFGMTKGTPGYAVYFHDKHGHRIGWMRMQSFNESPSLWFKYDLSNAAEEPSDFSLKVTDKERW